MYTNKINAEQEAIRAQLLAVLKKEVKALPQYLQELDGQDRVKALLNIAEFVLPKIGRAENAEAYRHTIFEEDFKAGTRGGPKAA